MGMQTGACERVHHEMTDMRTVSSVRFIARMQWVVCAEYSCIAVFGYADNRLTEIKRFHHRGALHLQSFAVHPTLPYLLSSSDDNFIDLWDWDKGWIIRQFECSDTLTAHKKGLSLPTMTFDPKDAYSFANLKYNGEINVCHSPLISLIIFFITDDHHQTL